MFKKIIIAAISASFVASAAFADSTNIGVRISAANLEASGTETTDQATTITQASKNADFALPSIFIERSIDVNSEVSISLGLDYVPLTAEISAINSGTGVDADIKAGNLVTAYIQPSYLVQENVRVFGKLGYAQGDLEVDNITRTANLDGETAPTDTGADKTLEGAVYGVGIQVDRDGGVFNFIRLEATHTDFDKVSHTNSNGKVLTADADMDLVTLTIGKSF